MRIADGRQVHAIHLGDVYYSGFAREYKNRFLRYWPVREDEADTGPLVSFARSSIAVHWKASRYQSILELAEACDVPVRWSCRTGVCHNCESGLIDGELRYEPRPLDPPAEGNVLLCCATPLTAVELDL